MVLDGEIVAVGGDGRPVFTRLVTPVASATAVKAVPSWSGEVPTSTTSLDVLAIDGVDIRKPRGRRREILDGVAVVDESKRQ